MIGQHVDTPTPQIVAKEKGVYSTGHHRISPNLAQPRNVRLFGSGIGF